MLCSCHWQFPSIFVRKSTYTFFLSFSYSKHTSKTRFHYLLLVKHLSEWRCSIKNNCQLFFIIKFSMFLLHKLNTFRSIANSWIFINFPYSSFSFLSLSPLYYLLSLLFAIENGVVCFLTLLDIRNPSFISFLSFIFFVS